MYSFFFYLLYIIDIMILISLKMLLLFSFCLILTKHLTIIDYYSLKPTKLMLENIYI